MKPGNVGQRVKRNWWGRDGGVADGMTGTVVKLKDMDPDACYVLFDDSKDSVWQYWHQLKPADDFDWQEKKDPSPPKITHDLRIETDDFVVIVSPDLSYSWGMKS